MPPSKVLDGKLLEIVMKLIKKQNEQLIDIIVEEEELDKKLLKGLVPSHMAMMQGMDAFLADAAQRH